MSTGEIAFLNEELEKLVITQARHSTKEYYNEWKAKSYPLNLASDKRARAIMFTMTGERPGWDEDVKTIYKMFKSFNIDVELVYDPDKGKIQTSLKAFVEHEENNQIDMCFIIFMGHGCTTPYNQHDVNLKITGNPGFFDIWSECANVFSKAKSPLGEKPKVFIVQACRDVKDLHKDPPMISLGTFTDYKFVFASQPGMVAGREHHFFIDTLSALVTKEAHRKHFSDMVTFLKMEFKKNQMVLGIKGQMPQTWDGLSYFLNIFPGITNDSLKQDLQQIKTSQQDSGGDANYNAQVAIPSSSIRPNEFKGNNPKAPSASASNNNEPKATDCATNPQQKENNKSSSHQKDKFDETQYKQDSTNKEKLDLSEKEFNNTECHAILEIQPTVKPSSDVNDQKTTQVLFDTLKKEEIEELLSAECESPVSVDNKTLGSILIHFSCDKRALEQLCFLSETGLLSSRFTDRFITEHILTSCSVCEVTLDVKLKIQDERILKSLSPMVYHLPDTVSCLKNGFTIKAPVQISGEAQWFHNDTAIKNGDRIESYTEEDKPTLKVTDACVADSGVYSCKYISSDGFPVLVKGRLLTINQTAPFDVKAVANSSEKNTINVSWEPAIGNITSYMIYHSHGDTDQSSFLSGITNAAITDVLPGETYNISVRSVSEEGVSDPEPPGGITVHTPPETPVGHIIPVPYVSGLNRVKWEKPRKDDIYIEVSLFNNIYVLPSEKEELNIQLLNKYVSGIYSCTVSSFYKGIISEKVDLFTVILYQPYTSLSGLVIQESKKEYYDSMKDKSYPVSLQTVRRGRAVVFITGGKDLQYRTDLDLLRLLDSLAIQFWLIYDPDVDTVDYYLTELVKKKEQDILDYCLVFFIGSRVENGINTHFVTSQKEYINVIQKCNSLFVRVKIPIFLFVNTCLECEAVEISSETRDVFLNRTGLTCSDLHILFTDTVDESDKWSVLNAWVNCFIQHCHEWSLEDITEHAVLQDFPFHSKDTPKIFSSLTRKLNLFPGLTCHLQQKQKPPAQAVASLAWKEPIPTRISTQVKRNPFDWLQKLLSEFKYRSTSKFRPKVYSVEDKYPECDSGINSPTSTKGLYA